jgi:hypothetical protein
VIRRRWLCRGASRPTDAIPAAWLRSCDAAPRPGSIGASRRAAGPDLWVVLGAAPGASLCQSSDPRRIVAKGGTVKPFTQDVVVALGLPPLHVAICGSFGGKVPVRCGRSGAAGGQGCGQGGSGASRGLRRSSCHRSAGVPGGACHGSVSNDCSVWNVPFRLGRLPLRCSPGDCYLAALVKFPPFTRPATGRCPVGRQAPARQPVSSVGADLPRPNGLTDRAYQFPHN